MARVNRSKQTRIGRAYGNSSERNSYKLTAQEILDRYATSATFRAIYDSGKYVYVDHALVLRSSECIELVGGQLRIKESALKNQSAYLYHQAIKVVLSGHTPMRTISGMPRGLRGHGCARVARVPGRGTKLVIDQHAGLIDSLTPEDLETILGVQSNLPGNFPDALKQLMKDRGYTEEGLAETSNLSTKTIQRLRNGTTRPKIETVVAICVGLSLDNYTGQRLINIAGLSFTNSKKDCTLSLIVGLAFEVNIYQVNDFLQRHGFKPLN